MVRFSKKMPKLHSFISHRFSDGTLLFQNDEVLQRMIAIKNSKDVSFGKRKGYISDWLA